jgi:hypothetical protein
MGVGPWFPWGAIGAGLVRLALSDAIGHPFAAVRDDCGEGPIHGLRQP